MTGPKTTLEMPIPGRSATAEDYKKLSGWQIGTLHRASTSEAPVKSSAAPSGDMSDLKTAASMQDRIDAAIREQDRKDRERAAERLKDQSTPKDGSER